MGQNNLLGGKTAFEAETLAFVKKLIEWLMGRE